MFPVNLVAASQAIASRVTPLVPGPRDDELTAVRLPSRSTLYIFFEIETKFSMRRQSVEKMHISYRLCTSQTLFHIGARRFFCFLFSTCSSVLPFTLYSLYSYIFFDCFCIHRKVYLYISGSLRIRIQYSLRVLVFYVN